MGSISERVARRTAAIRRAAEMTPAEWESYQKKHPDADRSKHKIIKPQPGKTQQQPGDPKPSKAPAPPTAPNTKAHKPSEPAKPQGKKPPPLPRSTKQKPPPLPPKQKPPPLPPKQKPEGAPPESKHDSPGVQEKSHGRFDAWKTTLKGLKGSAVKFVESFPKAGKSFLGDPDFRKAALKEAKEAVIKLPKAAVHRLVETAKAEVREFKDAGAGVKAMMSGKKMSKHQKHAFKTVAIHLAIGAAAAAFAATGPLVGATVFSKNLATHVALKSVKRALGSLHTLNEVSHIGHGVMHLLTHIASEGGHKEADPEEVMTNFILAAVAKQVEQLTDEDLTEVLNSLKESDSEENGTKTAALRVLKRFEG